ncbi:6-O-methylguanine DNA methyltransferase [Anaerosporomusa subterranea]|uniref:6-O-methylguanine DNA methyltransferase n=1 Tax=Anaerosporomusa subterranea TaxID=1794912 RepID=A0A154BV85_ANASB|nr:class I SAM-dependent methyltransferase [Anaerosporomusa subterranea]KYZ77398.1 6-O-methylguanine DNA methyltransferase [Anaerosporomusa subterranea]
MISDLDSQHPHWEKTFTKNQEMFGTEPSEPAQLCANILKQNGLNAILELGAGQGRDTIFFAQQGFRVYALEYTAIGVETIRKKAEDLGISHLVTVIQHDVKNPLPFENATLDVCYSHMLFCMAFTTLELETLSTEIRRVLNDGGLNIYTVRNTDDKHYGTGIHRGEDMYEINGFIVHFFNREKVENLAKGYEIVDVSRFQEGDLPRELFMGILRK